jgi:site-specific DNA-adenine methylase
MEFFPYIGSKRKHVERILKLIPANVEVCSPFLGSGHVEQALSDRGQVIHTYDAWPELVNLWKGMSNTVVRNRVAELLVELLPRDKAQFYELREKLQFGTVYDNRYLENSTAYTKFIKSARNKETVAVRGASFLALNRSSFNYNCRSFGAEKLSQAKLHAATIQERVRSFSTRLSPNLLDFTDSLSNHPNSFWFLDPPYYVSRGHYGYKGKLHHEFDHAALAALVHRHTQPWILTYNDHPQVRALYPNCHIAPLDDQARYRIGRTQGVGHIMISNRPLD